VTELDRGAADGTDTLPDQGIRETDAAREPEIDRDPVDTDPEYYDDDPGEEDADEEDDSSEFQTRQEAADEDRTWDGREWDDTVDREGTDSEPAEEEDLAEPRTRQDVADEDERLDQSDAPDSATDAEPDDEPSPEDRERLHALYQDYLKEQQSVQDPGRAQGSDIVSDKPDKSPGDTSDLPPTGQELVDMESSKDSRFDALLHEAEKEENLDGLHDALEDSGNTVEKLLTARPPEMHAEQPVPVAPYYAPSVPDHAIDGGSTVSAIMTAGIVTVHLVRWMKDRLEPKEGQS
jgi:hypothetical protein